MKGNILIFIFFFALSFFVFQGLNNTFYQQDEWHSLGFIKATGINFLTEQTSFFDVLTLGNRPLARLFGMGLLSFFPLNVTPAIFFAIIFHTLNSILLYFVIRELSINRLAAITGALFFLVNATGKQAILWISAAFATLPAVTAILFALIFYLKFLKTRNKKYLVITVISIILSLAFKEIALSLLVFLPVIELIYFWTKKKRPHLSKFSIYLLVSSLIFFVYKFFSVFLTASSTTRYITTSTDSGLARLIWNSITYPIESLSQIFIPDNLTFPFARNIMKYIFPYFETTDYAGIISEKIMVQFVSVIGTLLLMPIIFYLFLRKDKFPVIFTLILFILSFIPYIVLIKSDGYLESRYYYFSVAPASMFLALFMTDIIKKLGYVFKKSAIVYLFYSLILLIFGGYLLMNVSFIQKQLDYQIGKAKMQKYILEEILKEKPTLSKRQIFYIESDHNFIAPNNPLPFQNGIGYTLLVLYAYKSGDDGLAPFLNNNFFWEIGGQGYREYNGRGFGFFADFKELEKNVEIGVFQSNSIVAFRYDSEKNKLYDITDDVRNKLR